MLHPGVASIAHNSQQPGPTVRATETAEELKCPQIGLLHHVLSVSVIARQPARQIIGDVKVR